MTDQSEQIPILSYALDRIGINVEQPATPTDKLLVDFAKAMEATMTTKELIGVAEEQAKLMQWLLSGPDDEVKAQRYVAANWSVLVLARELENAGNKVPTVNAPFTGTVQ